MLQYSFISKGYVGNFKTNLLGRKIQYYLITRRSCKKAATRYNARGLDDDGNVANFNETE